MTEVICTTLASILVSCCLHVVIHSDITDIKAREVEYLSEIGLNSPDENPRTVAD
jgi:hypothetical protein